MNKNSLLDRGITVLVIALLIVLAFAPSIHANIAREALDGELVEITTINSICLHILP